MSANELIAHFQECSRRLSELRSRSDYVALSCVALRVEGGCDNLLADEPFARLFGDDPHLAFLVGSADGVFAMAFWPLANSSIQEPQMDTALARIQTITNEILPLLNALPEPVRLRLQLPDCRDWWRILFHLSWHFPRPFLNAKRQRLIGAGFQRNETSVQLIGMGEHLVLCPD